MKEQEAPTGTKKTKKTRKKQTSTAAGKQGWRKAFIESLGSIPNVSVACERASVARCTAYAWRNKSKAFAKQWDDAVKRGIELLEASMWRRASIGTKRPIWMKDNEGNPVKVDEVLEPDTTAAIFMLKAHAPEKYRETFRQEVSGPGGAPIQTEDRTEIQNLSKGRIRELITIIEGGRNHHNGNGHTPEANGNGKAHVTGRAEE